MLRYFGQSEQCCPAGNIIHVNKNVNYTNNLPARLLNVDKINALIPCDALSAEIIKNFLLNNEIGFDDYHFDRDIQEYTSYLYYPHAEYRKYEKFKVMPNMIYIQRGLRSYRLNDVVEGIKGVIAMAALLQYFCFATHLNFDAFHSLYGQAKKEFKLMKTNKLSAQSVEFCKKTNCHPDIIMGGDLPWVLKESTQKFTEKCINFVFHSTGTSGDWEVSKVFSSSGDLKGYAYIVLMMSVMDFLLYCAELHANDIKSPYINFYSSLSTAYAKLLSPVFEHNEVDNLQNEILELVALREGLFPIADCTMILHELVHLPQSIKNTGPLKCSWTLPGERAIKSPKEQLTIGGRSPFASCANKEFIYEKFKMDDTYKDFQSLVNNTADLYEGENNDDVYYSDFGTKLLYKEKENIEIIVFSEYEKSQLLIYMATETILLCGENVSLALKNSSLYRLYYSYLIYKRKSKFNYTEDEKAFWEFLYFLVSRENYFRDNKIIISYEIKLVENIEELLKQEYIFQIDVDSIKMLMNSKSFFVSKLCNKAIIYGIKFYARGSSCRETNTPKIINQRYGQQNPDIKTNNKENNLSDNFLIKKQFSSWCKVSSANNNYTLGQLNYFAEFSFPNDTLINKIKFSSITMRKSIKQIKYPNLDTISVDDTSSLDSKRMYSNLYNILSTRVMIAAFDSNNQPIEVDENVASHNSEDVKILVLFSLQRNRESIHKIKKLHPYYTTTQQLSK